MYRALTWLALRARRSPPADEAALAALARANPIEIEPTDDGDRVRVAGRDVTAAIRTPEVAAEVSEVSAHPLVRDEVVAAQRALLSQGSWVSDGRDVGTVVCPDADLKVFLTASLQERARRRRADLRAPRRRDGRGRGARGRAPPRPRRQHPRGEPAADRRRARS